MRNNQVVFREDSCCLNVSCVCVHASVRVQSQSSSSKRFSHTILLSHLQSSYDPQESHFNRLRPLPNHSIFIHNQGALTWKWALEKLLVTQAVQVLFLYDCRKIRYLIHKEAFYSWVNPGHTRNFQENYLHCCKNCLQPDNILLLSPFELTLSLLTGSHLVLYWVDDMGFNMPSSPKCYLLFGLSYKKQRVA